MRLYFLDETDARNALFYMGDVSRQAAENEGFPYFLQNLVVSDSGKLNSELSTLVICWVLPCWLDPCSKHYHSIYVVLVAFFVLKNFKLVFLHVQKHVIDSRVRHFVPSLVKLDNIIKPSYLLQESIVIVSLDLLLDLHIEVL